VVATGPAVVVVMSLSSADGAYRMSELGGKSLAFLWTTPLLAGGVAAFGLVRAARAISPWHAYQARTPRDRRRADRAADLAPQPRAPLALFGTGFAIGTTALLLAARPSTVPGTLMLASVAVGLGLGAGATLGLLAQCLWFSRFARPSTDPVAAPSPPPAPFLPGSRDR
jgi:uncharacterized membrane protein